MGSIPDPGGFPPGDTSFDEFQRQTSLMTSCTLLWKELSDHFTSLEQDILKKSDALKRKIETLDQQTKESLEVLKEREVSIEGSIEISLKRLERNQEAALICAENDTGDGEVDDGDGLLLNLKKFCLKMDYLGFWKFVTARKKELDPMRENVPLALSECVDPSKFVLEAISQVFPVDKRSDKSNDLGWACVLVLESLIPVVADPVIGRSRLLVTPGIRELAEEIAEQWKESLGGFESGKIPDVHVHTFLQHLVTFGIAKKEDLDFYRKLVVRSAWRKQMPKLAVSLGLADKMPDMIEELISKGQQLDAVHFAYEVNLVDKFPPIPLLKAYLRDARKAANSISEDHSNSARSSHLSGRKEQSALRAVIKCIEEYNLEGEFPAENLKKRLEQLEKAKTEKKRPATVVPANKRTRVSNGGPMPPAKAGRLTNAYVSSSFPTAPTFVRSPSHSPYSPSNSPYSSSHSPYSPVPPYPYDRPAGPAMYGNRSPSTNHYAYSPEAAPPLAGSYHTYSPEAASSLPGSYHGAPQMTYPAYGGYGNGLAPAYQQAYY